MYSEFSIMLLAAEILKVSSRENEEKQEFLLRNEKKSKYLCLIFHTLVF